MTDNQTALREELTNKPTNNQLRQKLEYLWQASLWNKERITKEVEDWINEELIPKDSRK